MMPNTHAHDTGCLTHTHTRHKTHMMPDTYAHDTGCLTRTRTRTRHIECPTHTHTTQDATHSGMRYIHTYNTWDAKHTHTHATYQGLQYTCASRARDQDQTETETERRRGVCAPAERKGDWERKGKRRSGRGAGERSAAEATPPFNGSLLRCQHRRHPVATLG
jgi:hypothetical protein